jgi:hypothetical protein
VALRVTDVRLRAGVDRPMRTRRAASADGSLTMITSEPQFGMLRSDVP